MSDAAAPRSLAGELAALSGRDRRAVLRALAPAERRRLGELLDREAGRTKAAAAEDFAAFSPWLAERLRQARDGEAAAATRMTASARRLLLEAARAPVDGSEPRRREAARAGSLLDAIGGLFEPRRWVR